MLNISEWIFMNNLWNRRNIEMYSNINSEIISPQSVGNCKQAKKLLKHKHPGVIIIEWVRGQALKCQS